MSIPLYWWRRKPNFGDLLSPIVVTYVSQSKVVYSEASGKLLAAGSILGLAAKENDRIWGSGLHSPYFDIRNIHVHAVRGPKTREFLLRHEIECPAVYGDPACLMPRIYNPSVDKRYQTAVLPHHSDIYLRQFALKSGLHVLSPCKSPLEVIDAILAAERLVTSSLHGLIIAEAYGIPVVLLRNRKHEWENHFKFVDYFLSTGREDHTVWDISPDEAVRQIPNIPKPVLIDTEKLIRAFPKEHFVMAKHENMIIET